MNGKTKQRPAWIYIYVLLVLSCVGISVTYYWSGDIFPDYNKDGLVQRVRERRRGYVLDTVGCAIPDLDPFDSSITKFVQHYQPIKCNATPAMTYVDRDYLRINRTALKRFYDDELDRCDYQSIHRPGPEKQSDSLYHYSEQTTSFSDDVRVTDNFIRVACYGKRGDMMYANFHPFILRKTEVEKRCKDALRVSSKPTHNRLNVLIIGVDSVSRLNYMRQLHKTRKYLVHTLGAVEMSSYNKVADNTYVNLVPMFAGKYVEELPWDEKKSSIPFDGYNFIWKNFSSRGYRTLFAEDAPSIAIFNYLKAGFFKKPMDYYLRPFSLAMEDHGSIWNSDHNCVGPKLETDVVLDYLTDFVKEFKHEPYFAISFITRLTHDNINKAGLADNSYLRFFRKLNDNGYLDNTAVVFFSDHGIRFGKFRETYIGKMEERLPFLSLILPKWFHLKYPKASKNLHINEHRLTTPFDVYATIEHIMDFSEDVETIPSKQRNQRGISLFNEISQERTCESASILPHWCTCHNKIHISVDDLIVKRAAHSVLDTINSELQHVEHLCAMLKLKTIVEALRSVDNHNDLSVRERVSLMIAPPPSHDTLYQIQLQTTPGDGIFEVTVKHLNTGNFSIEGDISRINEYGDQSTCMHTVPSLKKYCVC